MKPALQAARLIMRLARSRAALVLALFALLALGSPLVPREAEAAPFIWDQDKDGIDDRIENVHLLGYTFSFENQDTLARQRIEVVRSAGNLLFGVYVVFDHPPTTADLSALTLLGVPALHLYEGTPAVRSLATYAQVQAAAALSGVERVEAVPLLYPEVRDGAADIGVRDASQRVFPTWAGTGGADGTGVVVAFLDTGINDAADGAYPGHESLIGRCLGGASYVNGDSLVDTPRNGSVNPVDHGGSATQYHGTHVAGIAVGSGGPSGYAAGVAPGARYLDVKVLTDAGSGVEVGDGLDWCIHNRARDWGVAGYQGIQVINLSLSSTDLTDGNDVVSKLADRAVDLGIVVVASMGNGGQDHFVPSPAGASRALAVGAIDDQRSPESADDLWPSFDNYGPRADDQDGDPTNEQKPDLLAPGVAILSANGSVETDGTQYQRLSGTSMAAAFVSGAVAALRSAYPSLTPDAIANVLEETARRDLGGTPSSLGGPDPRWKSTLGYGTIDLYAARLELDQPSRSQIEGLSLAGSESSITATLRTQRERGATHFVFERASDLAGSPGAFTPVDSVTAAGDSSLADPDDRTSYARVWAVPANERGVTFWYRVSYTEGGVRYDTPSRPFQSPTGPAVATILLTVVHDAYDHDLTGVIQASGGGATFSVPLPGTSAAVSSDWVNGESTTGTESWTFRIDVPQGTASAPSAATPLWLRVDEGGYLNRSGRVTQFDVVWHGISGDVTYNGGPIPLVTVEGQQSYASIPQGSLAAGNPATARAPRFGPNPVVAGSSVSFAIPSGASRALEIFDLSGRRVATVPFLASAGASTATWRTRDGAGRALPAGVYLARLGAGRSVRIAVVRP
ncbi:MAG TPA: S8 family peptidase [Candidatus Udaeobacter sp.]|jgi:subtilisin family serine protease|nr:S8 family peptidase [Candidatus Udaeobacter sp.]